MSRVYVDKSKASACSRCSFRTSSHRGRAKHALLFHDAMVDKDGRVVPLDPATVESRHDELLEQLDSRGLDWRNLGFPGQRPEHWGSVAPVAPALSPPPVISKGRGLTIEYVDCEPECDLPAPGPVAPALRPTFTSSLTVHLARSTVVRPPSGRGRGLGVWYKEDEQGCFWETSPPPPPPEFADAPEDEDEEPSVYPPVS